MAFPPLPQPAEFDWKKFLVTALVNVLGKFVENIPPFLEKHSGTVATFFAGHLAKTSPDTAMWALLGLVITGIFCFMLHKLLTPRQSNFTKQQITAMEQRLTEVIKSEFLKLRAQSATSEQQLFTTSDQICADGTKNERQLTTSCCMETNQARFVKKAVSTDSLFTSFSRPNLPSADGELPDIRQRLELDCQLVILITLRIVNIFTGKALRYEDGSGENI
ncbi:hypothetical protein MJO29_015991 [Puccinia striiformis f. sp. tritici]|nr:hypothetical protein MJO29_015991 [Puccinia striiformis f. sp. tritici]